MYSASVKMKNITPDSFRPNKIAPDGNEHRMNSAPNNYEWFAIFCMSALYFFRVLSQFLMNIPSKLENSLINFKERFTYLCNMLVPSRFFTIFMVPLIVSWFQQVIRLFFKGHLICKSIHFQNYRLQVLEPRPKGSLESTRTALGYPLALYQWFEPQVVVSISREIMVMAWPSG